MTYKSKRTTLTSRTKTSTSTNPNPTPGCPTSTTSMTKQRTCHQNAANYGLTLEHLLAHPLLHEVHPPIYGADEVEVAADHQQLPVVMFLDHLPVLQMKMMMKMVKREIREDGSYREVLVSLLIGLSCPRGRSSLMGMCREVYHSKK